MGENPLRLLGVEAVADLLGTNAANVRAWIAAGELPCVRVGKSGEPRVSALMLEAWQRGLGGSMMGWTFGTCADCQESKLPTLGRTRWCADGNHRCTNHRLEWLEAERAESARVARRNGAGRAAGRQAAMFGGPAV